VSLGADEVDRVDPPLKSALNLNAVVVVVTSAAELLLARILREPPAAFAFVDLPEATTTYSVISTAKRQSFKKDKSEKYCAPQFLRGKRLRRLKELRMRWRQALRLSLLRMILK
jgi:hypothetical protein